MAPHRHGLYVAITLLVILIGIALATALLIPLAQGQTPSWSTVVATWDWLIAVVVVFLTVGILLWITRLALWGAGGPPPGHHRHRHVHDEYTPADTSDLAIETARQRYARGEITADQLDELLRQLGKSSRTN